MAICVECGLDPDRGTDPWEERHRRTSDALDLLHLRPGAQSFNVDVTAARRVAMNRIVRASGIPLAEQVRRALDVWLPAHRIELSAEEEGKRVDEPAAAHRR